MRWWLNCKNGRRWGDINELKLHFGALAPSLEKQLAEQGLVDKDIKTHQKIHDSMIMLYIHGYIPDSQRGKMDKKLFNAIKKKVKPPGGN